MLVRHLDPVFGKAAPATIRYTELSQIMVPLRSMLATLAWFGHAEESKAADAFAKGLAQLAAAGSPPPLPPREDCTLAAFDKAIEHLAIAAPMLKKKILDACTACCAADGFLTVEEGEMLRAVADALDCPIPPIIGY
jgi:hypothetical protein